MHIWNSLRLIPYHHPSSCCTHIVAEQTIQYPSIPFSQNCALKPKMKKSFPPFLYTFSYILKDDDYTIWECKDALFRSEYPYNVYASLCCCICKHHTLYIVLYLSFILVLLSSPLTPPLHSADASATTTAADDVCLFVTTISGEWWLKDEGTFFEENNIKRDCLPFLPIILILHYGETNDQHHPQPKLRSFRDQAKTIRYCIMYCRHMQEQESGPKD